MNTSQFMDKQIMDLTAVSQSQSQTAKDFIDLMDPPPQHGDNGIKNEEILPSYDFQPIRPITSSTLDSSSSIPGPNPSSRVWNSADSKATATTAFDRNGFDVGIVSEIDKTMKKYADNLVHILEGISARLTQLETRTRNVENSVDDLKVCVGNSHGTTDGKMRHLENILREVQTGVQFLKEKQEVVEAQLQVAKMQLSKVDEQQSETQNFAHMGTMQQTASTPSQPHQQLQQAASTVPQSHQQLQHAASAPPQSHQQLPPVTFSPSTPIAAAPPAVTPSPITRQNIQPPAQLPNQFLQSQVPPAPQRGPYYSLSGQNQEPPNPQYQLPPSQHPQPSLVAPPHQPYQLPPQPQYSQPRQLPQPQPSVSHHPEETPYIPSQSYLPNLRQPSSQPPGGAPSQQFYGASSHVFEPPSSRPSSGFSAGDGSGDGPPFGPAEPYPYGGSPSHYGGNPTIKSQLSSPALSQSVGSGYPQLPTARLLPQALPTASGISGGPTSPGNGNRIPIDDVVDKVTNMGFPREHVQATVRKLTESGKSVDLNIVLDKLMNDGEVQPQRGWFSR